MLWQGYINLISTLTFSMVLGSIVQVIPILNPLVHVHLATTAQVGPPHRPRISHPKVTSHLQLHLPLSSVLLELIKRYKTYSSYLRLVVVCKVLSCVSWCRHLWCRSGDIVNVKLLSIMLVVIVAVCLAVLFIWLSFYSVSWWWASMPLNVLFHYPYWYQQV